MHIPLPGNLTVPLWEGELETPAEVKSFRSGDGVHASIGAPDQWADGQLMGANWQPPQGGRRYHVLRLAFTLRPRGNARVTGADFCLLLGKQGSLIPRVFDAYPRSQTVEMKDSVTFGIGPKFQIGTGAAELAGAEATFDAGVVTPVVTVEGLQEPSVCWRYQAHDKYPLNGSRLMFAVISLPPEMPFTQAQLRLTVTQRDQLGPIPLGVPYNAQFKLQFKIG